MARRKRKDDEPDWVAPDFDEVGYMRRELEGARAAVATIGWAVIGALVAFALYSVLPVLAFFAGIAVGAGMYFVFPLIGIKTEPFKRRDWIGHGTETYLGGTYNATFSVTASTYDVTIVAVDTSGHSATVNFQIFPTP